MSTLRVDKREGGKPAQLRRRGLLPMAFVVRSHETIPVQASEDDVRRAVAHADGHGRIDVQLADDPTPRKAVLRHVEQDAIRKQILHVTLHEVAEDDLIKVDTPVVAIGTPAALETANDVVLTHPTDHVRLRGKVANLPERLEVDVTGLGVGEHINAGDVALPEGVRLDSSPDATLFSMTIVREPEALETPTGEEAGQDVDTPQGEGEGG